MQYFDGTRTLSASLDYFEHEGAYYVYHNLFGYILQMSLDVVHFLEFFHEQAREADEVKAAFDGEMPEDQLLNFINVFEAQSCLVETPQEEDERALRMVPVLARWTLAHTPPQGPVRLYVTHREDAEVEVLQLEPWASELWRRMDGEQTLEALLEAMEQDEEAPRPEGDLKVEALALVRRLAHHHYQALKFSPRPMSTFRAHTSRRGVPPYLSSSMPYRCITDEVRGLEAREDGEVIVSQLDLGPEVTLAYLLRQPHPALEGRTYGGALLDHVRASGEHLHQQARILVVGARRGYLARNLWERLEEVAPALASDGRLVVHVPSQELVEKVLAELGPVPAQIVVGDAEQLQKIDGLEGPFDLVVCNEYLALLDTVLLHKIPSLGSTGEEEEEEESSQPSHGGAQRQRKRDLFMGEGESVSYVFRYNLKFEDVDGEFFFNLGAVRLMEGAARLLAPAGVMVFVEYGDLFRYPQSSTQNGELLFSIHFNPLMEVGRQLGMEPSFDWLVNLLEVDRGMQMLSTTRRRFRAVQVMLAEQGLELEELAWSRDMLEAAIADAGISLEHIQGLEFHSLNDRVMGIVPSSLKILTLERAAHSSPEAIEL